LCYNIDVGQQSYGVQCGLRLTTGAIFNWPEGGYMTKKSLQQMRKLGSFAVGRVITTVVRYNDTQVTGSKNNIQEPIIKPEIEQVTQLDGRSNEAIKTHKKINQTYEITFVHTLPQRLKKYNKAEH